MTRHSNPTCNSKEPRKHLGLSIHGCREGSFCKCQLLPKKYTKNAKNEIMQNLMNCFRPDNAILNNESMPVTTKIKSKVKIKKNLQLSKFAIKV